jgi:cytochrome b561
MTDIALAPQPAYTLTARVLHWITAVLVLTMIPIGLVMANVEFEEEEVGDFLFHIHRSIGATLLPIVAFRLIWRLTHPPLPLPPDVPPIQRRAAHTVHWLLYALLLIQGMVGWIATSAYRAPILVFWLFELPPIWPEDKDFSEKAFVVHQTIGITIAVLVCIHIAGALYHHFIRRDRVLMRMITG